MKKIHAIIFLLALIISIPFAARADVVVLAQLTLKDAHVVTSSGSSYSIAFTIHNGGEAQSNIRYGVRLVPVVNGTANYSSIADEKILDEVLSVNSNRDLTRTISYTVPASLDGTYKMLVVVNNANGLPLGSSFVADVSTHSQANLSINTASCYLSVEGEKSGAQYTLDQGVDVASSENLLLNCKATNNSNQALVVSPEISTFLRSQSGALVYTPASALSFSFAAHESKTVTVSIPKPTKPQAYTSVVDLANGSGGGIPSNTVSAHWVLRGMSGTIQNVSLDKDIYAAGNVAVVAFTWSGKADSFAGSRAGTSTPLSSLMAHVSVCDQGVDYPLKGNGGVEHVAVSLVSGCTNPHAIVSLVSGDSVLGTQDVSVRSPEQTDLTPATTSFAGSLDAGTGVAIVVIILLVLVVAILALRTKNGRNIIIFILAGSALSLISSVHAETPGHSFHGNGAPGSPFVPTVTNYSISLLGTSPSVNAKYVVTSEIVARSATTSYELVSQSKRVASESVNKMNAGGAPGIAEVLKQLANPRRSENISFSGSSLFKDDAGVGYVCNFNVFPRIDATVSGATSGRPIPPESTFALTMHPLSNPTCSYKESTGATTTIPVMFDAAVTLTTVRGLSSNPVTLGSTVLTGSLVSPATTKPDRFTISTQYNLKLADGKKIGTYHEVNQTGYMSPYETVGVVLESGGGTILVSSSAAQNDVVATISLNGISFNPGKTVAVTATDPVVVLCTNGASGALYINYDVYKVGSDVSLYSEKNTHAVTNHPLVNTPAKPLASGAYYLVAKYYASRINLYHQVEYHDELEATVIIPFIVTGGTGASSATLTAPIITGANGMCLPSKTPQALISWKSVSAAASYGIERSADGVTFSPIASNIATNTRSFIDNSVPAGTPGTFPQYTYRVSAFDAMHAASTTKFGILFPDCSASGLGSTTPPITGAPFCQLSTLQHQVIVAGNPVTVSDISWSSLNTDSCTGTGFATSNATSGSASVFVGNNTTFGLSCINTISHQTCQSSSTVNNMGVSGPVGGPAGACTAPQNAQLCVNSDASAAASTTPAVLRAAQASCTSSVAAPVMCEFFCPANFQKSGSRCVLSGSIQEK
jgi:hypothetical protein